MTDLEVLFWGMLGSWIVIVGVWVYCTITKVQCNYGGRNDS